jgi:RimJ/RimL family protein N-acetyltransferase
MKRLMLDHIFAFVDEVHFVIGPQNIRSQQAIQRVGGTLLGTRMVRGAENVVFRIVPEPDPIDVSV